METKKPSEWNEEDLIKHLRDADPLESEELEFKSGKLVYKPNSEVKETIAKALSAFGNREEGGNLVLGVDEETGKIDGVPAKHKGNAIEWLDRLLRDATDPISAWTPYAIDPSGSQDGGIPPGQAVFVLTIPPHPKMPIRSTVDKEYYYRSGRSSFPMNQRQLLDFISRPRYAQLEVLRITVPYEDHTHTPEHVFDLQLTVRNSSLRAAVHSAAELFLPKWLSRSSHPGRYDNWGATGEDLPDPYHSFIRHIAKPVFPHEPVDLEAIRLTFDASFGRVEYGPPYGLLLETPCIGVILYADDAPPRRWHEHVHAIPQLRTLVDAALRPSNASLHLMENTSRAQYHVQVYDIDLLMRRHLGEQEAGVRGGN